jgi:hypothetical protein
VGANDKLLSTVWRGRFDELGGRRQEDMVRVAAAACRAVCELLAGPEDADALLEAVALRHAPSELQLGTKDEQCALIGKTKMATTLVHSFTCARDREAPQPELVKLLSTFTSQYSLRLFNETFELQLAETGGAVTKHVRGGGRTRDVTSSPAPPC